MANKGIDPSEVQALDDWEHPDYKLPAFATLGDIIKNIQQDLSDPAAGFKGVGQNEEDEANADDQQAVAVATQYPQYDPSWPQEKKQRFYKKVREALDAETAAFDKPFRSAAKAVGDFLVAPAEGAEEGVDPSEVTAADAAPDEGVSPDDVEAAPEEGVAPDQVAEVPFGVAFYEDIFGRFKQRQEAEAAAQAQQEQQAQAQAVEAAKKDADPRTWSSTRFKAEAPKPRTLEEKAAYDAALAQKTQAEAQMKKSLLGAENGQDGAGELDPAKTPTEANALPKAPVTVPQAIISTLKNMPLIDGQSIVQIQGTNRLLYDVFERPAAGLRAVAKDAPMPDGVKKTVHTFMTGFLNPENYPAGTFATSLQDAANSPDAPHFLKPLADPIIAGTLGTIADAGYYFGVPEAMGKIVTAGKMSLLKDAVENFNRFGEEAFGRTVTIPEEAYQKAARDKNIFEILDAWVRAKNIKLRIGEAGEAGAMPKEESAVPAESDQLPEPKKKVKTPMSEAVDPSEVTPVEEDYFPEDGKPSKPSKPYVEHPIVKEMQDLQEPIEESLPKMNDDEADKVYQKHLAEGGKEYADAKNADDKVAIYVPDELFKDPYDDNNKKQKPGAIRASSSIGTAGSGKIGGPPFEYEGKKYVAIGFMGNEAQAVEVIPADEYKGTIYKTAAERQAAVEKGKANRYEYSGQLVTYKGKQYVFGERSIFRGKSFLKQRREHAIRKTMPEPTTGLERLLETDPKTAYDKIITHYVEGHAHPSLSVFQSELSDYGIEGDDDPENADHHFEAISKRYRELNPIAPEEKKGIEADQKAQEKYDAQLKLEREYDVKRTYYIMTHASDALGLKLSPDELKGLKAGDEKTLEAVVDKIRKHPQFDAKTPQIKKIQKAAEKIRAPKQTLAEDYDPADEVDDEEGGAPDEVSGVSDLSPVEIPKFKNTMDALAFAKEHAGNADVLAELKRLHAAVEPRFEAAMKAKDAQEAMNLSTESQLYREAFEEMESIAKGNAPFDIAKAREKFVEAPKKLPKNKKLPKFEDIDRVAMADLVDDIRGMEAKKQMPVEETGKTIVNGYVPAYLENQGVTKAKDLPILRKALAGEPLTDKQHQRINELIDLWISQQEARYGRSIKELYSQLPKSEAEEALRLADQDEPPIEPANGFLQEAGRGGDAEGPGGPGQLEPGSDVEEDPETANMSATNWQKKLEKDAKVKGRVNKTELIRWTEDAFGIQIRSKLTHQMRTTAGFYKTKEQLIRLAKWGELEVMTHEVAHHIDFATLRKTSGRFWWKDWTPDTKLRTALTKELADLDYDQKQRRTFEGWAEYVRHWVTDTGLAQKLAPELTKWIEGGFKTAHPEIAAKLAKMKELYSVWDKQGAVARVLGHVDFKGEHTRQPLQKKLAGMLDYLREKFTDEFTILKTIEDKLGLESRKNLAPTKSPYEMATYMKQKASGIARTFVMESAVDEYGQKVGKSLADILAPLVKGDVFELMKPKFMQSPERMRLGNFIAYWVSKRALQVGARGMESGFDVEDAKHIIAKYQSPEFDLAAKELTDFTNHAMDWLVRSGGMNQASADMIRAMNPVYAPFKRAFMDNLEVMKVSGKTFGRSNGVMKFRGSGRPIINPIESIIKSLTETFSKAHKMTLARLIADLAQQEGAGGYISRIPLATTAQTVNVQKVLEQVLRKLKDEGQDVDGLDLSNLDELMTVFVKTDKYNGKGNVVPVFRNGEVTLYEVHPDLFRALQAVEPLQLNSLTRILSPFTRLLRLGATGINPVFGLGRNPIKDFLTATVFSKSKGYSPLAPLKGIAQDVMNKPIAQRFKAAGGDIASQMGYDRAQTMAVYDEALLKALGKTGQTLMIVKHPIDFIRQLVNIPEMGPRIAELEKSIARYKTEHPTWSDDDVWVAAFNDAQDITINFSRSGKWGKQLNQAAFAFNASIQGPAKFYRSLKEDPFRTTIKGFLYLTIPAIALWFKNREKDWYKNLHPNYKYNNFFAELPDGTVVRSPIPYDIGAVFISTPTALLDAYYDHDPAAFTGLRDVVAAQVPDPTPDMVGPLWDVASNRDFLNRPIESKTMERLPSEERKRSYTPESAVALSRGLNAMGWKLSPVQIDYLINSYTGGIGRNFSPRDIKGPADVPFTGAFVLRNPHAPSRQLDAFYTRLTELQEKKAADTLKHGAETRDYMKYQSFQQNNVGPLMKAIRAAQDSGNDKKVEGLNRKLAQVLDRLNKRRTE